MSNSIAESVTRLKAITDLTRGDRRRINKMIRRAGRAEIERQILEEAEYLEALRAEMMFDEEYDDYEYDEEMRLLDHLDYVRDTGFVRDTV